MTELGRQHDKLDDDDDDEDEGTLETSLIQKLLSPLYLLVLLAFLVTACIPLWFLLTMFLMGLRQAAGE